MKKFFLLLATVCFVAMAASSCKKCSTCEYTVGGTKTVIPEVCGKKSAIDTYEKNAQTAATAVGATATCTSK